MRMSKNSSFNKQRFFFDWCCFYYVIRNSPVALLEALFARFLSDPNFGGRFLVLIRDDVAVENWCICGRIERLWDDETSTLRTRCVFLQHTATHCSTLQYTATVCCSVLQCVAVYCVAVYCVAHCNTRTTCCSLQHSAQHTTSTLCPTHNVLLTETLCTTLTATPCTTVNTLHNTQRVAVNTLHNTQRQHSAQHTTCCSLQHSAQHSLQHSAQQRRSWMREMRIHVEEKDNPMDKTMLCVYKYTPWHRCILTILGSWIWTTSQNTQHAKHR